MRAKIILPNLLAVLAAGLASFFIVGKNLGEGGTEKLQKQMEVTSRLFQRSEALRGYELLFDVRKQAMTKDVTQAFAPVAIDPVEGESEQDRESRIRQAWFRAGVQAVEMYSELWAARGDKKPELVFLTDHQGVVLARNTTPNACPAGRNVSAAMPVVQRALDGEATYSIWSAAEASLGTGKNACKLINTKLLEMAAAPIWAVSGEDDGTAGALVIGFEVSNGVAQDKKEALGLDVAVLINDEIYSSSFTDDNARQSLAQQLKKVASDKVNAALDSGKPSAIFELEISGETYMAKVIPSINADKSDRIAHVLMGSLNDAAVFDDALVVILVLMGAACLIVIIAGILLGGHFIKPVMEIEEGLLKVINGEFEYRFDVKSAEVGGLSYRINQLIGVLTGEEEETEE